MIRHLSFRHGRSVNDFIPSEFCSVHYASVNDALRIIKKLGIGCTLAKTDVGSAFRIIPVHPKGYHLLGMKWRDEFYVDCCLSMGLASSCINFEKLSTAKEWMARNKLDIPHIINILDDFLIAAEFPSKRRTNLQNSVKIWESPWPMKKPRALPRYCPLQA